MKTANWLPVALVAAILIGLSTSPAAEPTGLDLFAKDNLVAWCIVPFDAAERTPQQRAEMLNRLGLKRLAYDWREQHVPTFEDEIVQMKKHGIEFFAFWGFHPAIEPLVRKHKITPQFWQTLSGGGKPTRAENVEAAARGLLPLVEKTRTLGCKFGLYNHGGWGGEPENLVAVVEWLRANAQADHVGIVYNLHHGHGHIADFDQVLARMKPYLLCLNLNGMNDDAKPMILPIGSGQHDRALLEIIVASGYAGPIGILDHRNELDAEQSLRQNLDGLAKMVEQIRESAPRKALHSSDLGWTPNQDVSEKLAALLDADNLRAGVELVLDHKYRIRGSYTLPDGFTLSAAKGAGFDVTDAAKPQDGRPLLELGDDNTLRNLTITYLDTPPLGPTGEKHEVNFTRRLGIQARGKHRLLIQNCRLVGSIGHHLKAMDCRGVQVVGCHVAGGHWSIFLSNVDDIVFRRCLIEQCQGDGIKTYAPHDIDVNDCVFGHAEKPLRPRGEGGYGVDYPSDEGEHMRVIFLKDAYAVRYRNARLSGDRIRPVYVSSIGGSRHLSKEAAEAFEHSVSGNVVAEPAPPIKPGVKDIPFACGPQ